MAEVIAVRGTNKLTVASTFSGAGGSCLGFEMAGFDVRYANEFVPAAQDTYRLNHSAYLDTRDIRAVSGADILRLAKLKPGELDVLEGSPPCAAFSRANCARGESFGRVKSYSDTKQRVDDLFFEYIRLLDELKPRAFVAENVAGLVAGVAYGHFETIARRMREAGYRFVARVLDAQWLGVPQVRARLIFVGVRDDLDIEPAHPKPLGYRYAMRDAVPDIVNAEPKRFAADRKEGPIDFSATSIGPRWRRCRVGENSETVFTLWRPNPLLPSPTITASCGVFAKGSITHPHIPRQLNTFELRRLCAFPDDFQLTGTYEQKAERLGRSVPPLMMFRVARTLRDEVFAKLGKLPRGASEVTL